MNLDFDQISETTSPLIAIQEAKRSIANRRPEDFTKWLQQMPLDKLSKSTGDYLLTTFLVQIAKYKRPEFIQLLFKEWERIYPREEEIPFYVILFTIPLIPISTLQFVILNIEGVTLVEIIESLMTFHYQEISTACQKAWDVFGSQPYSVVLTLHQLAKGYKNPVIFNFLTGKIQEVSPYAKIPGWVKDFRTYPGKSIYQPPEDQYGVPRAIGPTGPLLPTYQETLYIPPEPVVKLPSTNQILDVMLEGLSQKGTGSKEINRVKSELASRLVLMDQDEKMKMVKPLLLIKAGQSRQDDPLLHRLYGPANPNVNPTVEEMLYGGERMFTSLVISDTTILGDMAIDWFVGYCQQCNFRLRRRWHAVRIPNESGGWIGCYCSWKCARKSLMVPDSFDGLADPSLISLGLIDQFEKQSIKLGVQDRRDNGDILPEQDSSDFD